MRSLIVLVAALAVWGCADTFRAQNHSYQQKLEAEAKASILASQEMAGVQPSSSDRDPELVSKIHHSNNFRMYKAQYGEQFVMFAQAFPSVMNQYRYDCVAGKEKQTAQPFSLLAGQSKLLTFPENDAMKHFYRCDRVTLSLE